jgi:hypothetical protein
MKHTSLITILLLIITSSSNCIKNGTYTAQLPPATQEGKNTCGFLVNGKVWLPRGDNGYPNLSCDYDETFMGGAFNINGYRYESGANNSTSFVVGSDSIQSTGLYKLNLRANRVGRYRNGVISCTYQWYDTVISHNAYLNITKLDKTNRIISGTFEFSQVKQNCEEVRITQGRFDMNY